ncbi:MAG: iron ABC transporter permease [Defluviitaleaceae bacterium]|nr:iron ABC transporter permease [Defluviitaleaceae bacterium]MCL2836954.1 iron ABC transporter permease [Defluviitaleaceae bacterium]
MRKYFVITGLLVALAFVLSLRVGRYPLSARDILMILTGSEISGLSRGVFFTLRLPRTVMALMVGAGLGLAGSVFQLIFKNPLASPDIIGVSSGANLGAALAIVFFGQSAALMAASAFGFAMLAVALVAALSRLGRFGGAVSYILFGIIIKAVCESVIMILKFFADPERELAAMEFWAMGSLGNITASKLAAVAPFFLIGFAGLVIMRRHIMLLGLEDDESRSLGARVKLIRTLVLGAAALTVASVISMTGLVVFVGLNAPHAARLMIKRVSFAWMVLSAMIGALILLVSDCFARGISGVEIPVSIPTTFIGVPVLLVFMLKRQFRG